MKTIRLLTLSMLAACMGAATAQNIDALPSLAGTAVDRTLDRILIRDASIPAAAGALRSMPIGDIVNIPGLFGNGVATALAKPTGATGAVQLVGDPLTPTAIILPDMTGLITPAGAVGYNGGKLAVGDGVTVGGRPASPPRYTGTKIWTFGTQAKSAAFVKLFGIPISAENFVGGKKFTLTGRVTINNHPALGGISNITSMPFGLSFLAGSTALWNGFTGGTGDTNWNARPFGSFTSVMGSNPVIIDFCPIADYPNPGVGFYAAPNSPTKISMLNPVDYIVTRAGSAPIYYSTDSLGCASAHATAGVANELCLMLQIQTSNSGNYSNEKYTVNYDVALEFTN